MARYAAFLRGINVGGRATVPMEALRACLSEAGFLAVRTLLNSGNVVFEMADAEPDSVAAAVEAALGKSFGRTIPTLVRTASDVAALVAADPFARVPLTPETRLYVTFPSDRDARSEAYGGLAGPAGAVYWHLEAGEATTDAMAKLERSLPGPVTTRNWNTVLKVAKALD